MKDFLPIHPGEILLEDFLKPMNISRDYLAESIGVSAETVKPITSGEKSILADVALRLGYFFSMEAQF